ncbi:hypothetical protein JQ634_35385 [Bradyrhizobium sp. AUGA SZCCT0240]|uniref:hypothetical protein n=1 Tax=unclassified Bradyrhizobium TaxID=2631580 RepID=UPI001BA9F081|nr:MULTISPECIES: hypothetical protein [unclassified Bradyrhizobium]MBR1193873.1 hypothetical protein [Bradyrhizobium sp. AUGA SZCCT0160]MBR1200794.1 hypothetical protein [Bradyrhizobium sp. AUGA SZCCT0158]MBR1245129.1 hypothetical protein [Bradyrhizobium sp. AUGA SZCCT0274]MBR1258939.1 hypothetical protein [Bradyrhizobium sp. AUGA SZCCT0240]
MTDGGWQRKFDEPIETPDGNQLHTLREAIVYLAETVPKSERDMPAVTTAAEMLTNAAERGAAWIFLARMATLKAIHRHEVRQFNPNAKEHHWGRRRLKRDK